MEYLSKEIAQSIAEEWIDSWNKHDLERILSHYTNDFEMSSPFIARMYPDSGGKLKGKDLIGEYWGKALEKFPDLTFELKDVLFSIDTICIVYQSVNNLRAIEWLKLRKDTGHLWKICEAAGHYHAFP